jgi:hypothetical protein
LTNPLENPIAIQNQSGLQCVDNFVLTSAIGRHITEVICSLKQYNQLIVLLILACKFKII